MVDGAPTAEPSEESTRSEDLPDRLRVHSLARTLGTTSKRVLDALSALDGRIRSAHSTVDREDAVRVRDLLAAQPQESPENAGGEYYLTDVVEVLYDAGYNVVTMVVDDPMEAAGVNDRAQLATAEAELRDRTNERWMRRGVTMLDPERTYIDATVELAPDVTLFPGTLLQGRTVIATGAEIGPDTRLVDCVVGEEAIVEQTVGRQAEIGAQARVGPFAVLPPGTQVASGTVTGPFFEAGYEEGA